MRLSRQEREFFERLKNVDLSHKDRSELRLRSPALAEAIADYQQRHSPSQPVVRELRSILPELSPEQMRLHQQQEALRNLGYSLDLEALKVNNPWLDHNPTAMLIIEQIRPHWVAPLKALAQQRKHGIPPEVDALEAPDQEPEA